MKYVLVFNPVIGKYFGDFVFCYESNIITAKDEKADVLVDKVSNLVEKVQYIPEYILEENDIFLRLGLIISQLELCILFKNYLSN